MVAGPRTAMGRFFGWYIGKLHRAGAQDARVASRFLEVANLMASPSALLAPQTALRVLRGNLVRMFSGPGSGPSPAEVPQLDC